jgi:hypothetical protein
VETGRRTIAVNTDFRRPRLAEAINGEPAPEQPYDLNDLELVDPKLLLLRTDHANLLMMDLSSIEATPGELVRSTVSALPQLLDVSDEVVIDTSPVGITAEPLELVPFADVIVMVIRLGHTSIEQAEATFTASATCRLRRSCSRCRVREAAAASTTSTAIGRTARCGWVDAPHARSPLAKNPNSRRREWSGATMSRLAEALAIAAELPTSWCSGRPST